MSRHTKNDGVTPDEKIIEGVSFDEWLQELAPPDRLVGAYYRKEIDWEDYEKRYLDYLRSPEINILVRDLAKRCTKEVVTLLCVERESDSCHRRLLAEELRRYESILKVIHK